MSERLSAERLGCLDGGCVFAPLRDNSGQHTNGGCRCLKELPHKLRRDLRALVDEVKRLRAEVAELRQAEADWEAHDARECPGFQHCDVHCPGGE